MKTLEEQAREARAAAVRAYQTPPHQRDHRCAYCGVDIIGEDAWLAHEAACRERGWA